MENEAHAVRRMHVVPDTLASMIYFSISIRTREWRWRQKEMPFPFDTQSFRCNIVIWYLNWNIDNDRNGEKKTNLYSFQSSLQQNDARLRAWCNRWWGAAVHFLKCDSASIRFPHRNTAVCSIALQLILVIAFSFKFLRLPLDVQYVRRY